jgi:hypothetical protein
LTIESRWNDENRSVQLNLNFKRTVANGVSEDVFCIGLCWCKEKGLQENLQAF